MDPAPFPALGCLPGAPERTSSATDQVYASQTGTERRAGGPCESETGAGTCKHRTSLTGFRDISWLTIASDSSPHNKLLHLLFILPSTSSKRRRHGISDFRGARSPTRLELELTPPCTLLPNPSPAPHTPGTPGPPFPLTKGRPDLTLKPSKYRPFPPPRCHGGIPRPSHNTAGSPEPRDPPEPLPQAPAARLSQSRRIRRRELHLPTTREIRTRVVHALFERQPGAPGLPYDTASPGFINTPVLAVARPTRRAHAKTPTSAPAALLLAELPSTILCAGAALHA